MMRYLFCAIFFISHSVSVFCQKTYRKELILMGSHFDVTVVANSFEDAEKYIDWASDEIKRIEYLLSEWKPETEVSKINQNAGIQKVKVSKEVIDIIQRAKKFSEISNGAFDISFASISPVWKFDGSMTKLPNPEEINQSIKKINYKNIIVDEQNQTVFLKEKGMKIGFGSIGKGYAADQARKVLIAKGVQAGIVNASGDLSTWGTHPNGEPWVIGITNPMDAQKTIGTFSIKNGAVATSGNYEKFVTIDGKRYTHIINPKTGYPVEGVASVTVFAESAELANGLSTSVMVLGVELGLNLLNQIPNIEAIIIDDKGKIYTTKHIELNAIN